MASTSAVWGIDVGQCALKALKLRPADNGQVEALAFDVIEHPKLLSQPDADRDQLIASALEKFASRNEWQGDKFVIGVPGQQTFARFCKMPPIDLKRDAKKIPELVRYEASQQIPFDMDDVVWDYQVFASEDSPEIEVGIFAIRKDLIRKHLGFFAGVGIAPLAVQAVPAALYNFCVFDKQAVTDEGATVIVDVGAQTTDLIIVEANSVWTRNIPLGGSSFTEALVRAFKLSFAKAESLKRSAADSKYARQIFQAMRPVFADLVAEIQRSIGFYGSTHRDVELKRVLALGNAFLLPGLQKYLENNLTIPGGVGKLEKFRQLVPNATINAPQFTENVLAFGAAYGLALQGLGLGRIRATLLPPELARIAAWQKKRPYFAATAAVLGLAAALPWASTALARQTLESERVKQAQNTTESIIREANRLRSAYQQAVTDTGAREADLGNVLNLQAQRLIVPRLLALVHEAMPPVNPPELASVATAAELRKLIESNPDKYARTERGQFIIESLQIEYLKDINTADLAPRGKSGGGGTSPAGGFMGGGTITTGGRAIQQEAVVEAPANAGFIVRIDGRLLYRVSRSDASRWLEGEYFRNLREKSHAAGLGFHIPDDDPKDMAKRGIGTPAVGDYFAAAGGGPVPIAPPPPPPGLGALPTGETQAPARTIDPVTGEDAKNDKAVSFAFKVALGDYQKPPAAEGQP